MNTIKELKRRITLLEITLKKLELEMLDLKPSDKITMISQPNLIELQNKMRDFLPFFKT